MKPLAVLLAAAAAIALQLTMARYAIVEGRAVDLVLVVVVFVALTMGPLAGLATGTAAGLAQDALSGGLVGVGGLAKSVVGFLVGTMSQQLIVGHALARFLTFVAATIMHGVCVVGVYGLLEPRNLQAPWGEVLAQAMGNGVVGVLAFMVMRVAPEMVARRRLRRRVKRRW